MHKRWMLASTIVASIAMGGLAMSTTAFAATSGNGNQYQNQSQNQPYGTGPAAGPGLAYGWGPMGYGWSYGPGSGWGYRPGYCAGLGLGFGWGNGYGYGLGLPGYNYGEWDYSLVETLTPAETTTAINDSLTNATINKTNNSVTYTGTDVKIVVLAAPQGQENKFVVGGLTNPTIYIAKGATVEMRLVNEDLKLPHGLAITSAQPPYESVGIFQQTGIYTGSLISPIPWATDTAYPTDVTVFTASKAGTFYYVCQVPTHAENGMYGKVVIN
ncbi:hypothetical protein JZ785_21510 [Alicyclobacillus curvatus]|nr:hypothetical protein JZ785_21510 [Alicyclobacillus curvatus]